MFQGSKNRGAIIRGDATIRRNTVYVLRELNGNETFFLL